MLADLIAEKEAGEDRSIGVGRKGTRLLEMICSIIDSGYDRPPVQDRFRPNGPFEKRSQCCFSNCAVNRLNSLIVYPRPGDQHCELEVT